MPMKSPMFELPDLNESFYITKEKQSFNALRSILYFSIDFDLQLFIFVYFYLDKIFSTLPMKNCRCCLWYCLASTM